MAPWRRGGRHRECSGWPPPPHPPPPTGASARGVGSAPHLGEPAGKTVGKAPPTAEWPPRGGGPRRAGAARRPDGGLAAALHARSAAAAVSRRADAGGCP